GGTVYLWGPSWKAPRVASGTPFVRIRSSRRAGSVHPSPAAPPDATTAPRSKVTPWLFEEELHVAPVAGLQSPSGHRAGGAGPHAGQPERRRTCHRAFGTPRTVPGPMGRLAGGRLPEALRSPSGSGEPARRAALRPAVPLQLRCEPLLLGRQQRRSLASLPLPAGSHPPAGPRLRGLPAGEPALCRQGGGALPAGGHHLCARLPADAGAPDASRAAPRVAHRLLPAHPPPVLGGLPHPAVERGGPARKAGRRPHRLPHRQLHAALHHLDAAAARARGRGWAGDARGA